MYDPNGFGSMAGGGFGGLGSTLSNLSNNPLLLASLQMMGNNSPRIGQLPNTMEGVPQIMMAGNQQLRAAQELARKRAEEDADKAAIAQSLMTMDFSPEEAKTLSASPKAAEFSIGHRKTQREEAAYQAHMELFRPRSEQEHGGEDEDGEPSLPQQRQQAPVQQAPAPQRPMRQTGEPDAAMQQALADTSSKFDAFGQQAHNKTVGELAKELAANNSQTAAAQLINAAKAQGLSPDSQLTADILKNPATAMPLARALGIGRDLPDDAWTQAHDAAKKRAWDRDAAGLSAQRQPDPGQVAPPIGMLNLPAANPNRPAAMPTATGQQAQQRPPLNLPFAPGPQAAPEQRAPNPGQQAQAATPVAQAEPQQERAPVGPKTRDALIKRDRNHLRELEREMGKHEAAMGRPGGNVGMKKASELKIQSLEADIKETRKRISENKRADEEGIPLGHDEKTHRELNTKKDFSEAGLKEARETSGNIVVQDIDKAVKLIKESPAATTGGGGQFLQYVPWTNAHNAEKLLKGVRTNIGFDKLQAMRAQSPTGAALGSVSDTENAMLQSVMGSLELSQSKDQLLENLARVKWLHNDIVHKGSVKKGATVPTFKTLRGEVVMGVKQRDGTTKWFEAD